MDEDLVSHIFPLTKRDSSSVKGSTSKQLVQSRRHDILDFKCPIEINKTNSKEVNCITHKYQSKDIYFNKEYVKSLCIIQEYQLDDPFLVEENFFIVKCKSSRAKFFPEHFQNGVKGRCIFTTEGAWLTPVEFQIYSGCASADWKTAVKLLMPDSKDEENDFKNKKSNFKSVKTLIEEKILTLKSSDNDKEFSGFEQKNSILLNTLLLNFENEESEFLMLSPSKKNISNLEVKIFKNSTPLCSKILESHKNTIWSCKHPIKQIDTKLFDKNLLLAKSVEQCVTMLNLKNQVAQMNLLEIEMNGMLLFRNIYELNFEKNCLSHVEASHFIKGESALLYDSIIYLANDTCNNDLKRLTKISQRFEPLFSSNQNWNSVKFGAGPRQIIYSDSTQMISIDSRVPNLINKRQINIFTLPNKCLYDTNEIIDRTQTYDNHHFISCSKSVAIVDERYPNRPLIIWKNLHQRPLLHLDVVNLFEDDTRAIISCDENEVYSHLFSLKKEVPVSFNYPYMLSSSIETRDSDDFNENFINNPIGIHKPNISYSIINSKDFMGLFEMNNCREVYYQRFNISNIEEKSPSLKRKSSIKKLENLQSNSGVEKLEEGFKEMNFNEEKQANVSLLKSRLLPKPSRQCKICMNESNFSEAKLSRMDEICPKCGLDIRFSNNIMLTLKDLDQTDKDSGKFDSLMTKIFDFDSVAIEQDKLTKELDSIWN